jgi:hypothetical protein
MHHNTAAPSSTAHRTRHTLPTALLCACMALCLFSAAPTTHAADKKTGQTTNTAAHNASSQKKGGIKIKHYRSTSEESTADRDRRMYRECWGRPNAGACSGYTRR